MLRLKLSYWQKEIPKIIITIKILKITTIKTILIVMIRIIMITIIISITRMKRHAVQAMLTFRLTLLATSIFAFRSNSIFTTAIRPLLAAVMRAVSPF